MSLLGYDNNDKTLSGDVDVYATNVYATNIYDGAVNVGDTLITLQAEIDALEAQIISTGTTGYYFLGASNNNPNNTLAEKKLYFNQQVALNGFTLVGTGVSATQITATYNGVYNIYYKINYQKVNATTAYEVRTWIMKNGVDVDYTTTIQTMDTAAQWMTVSNQYIVSLNAGDYVEIVWYSPNANATNDILDFIGATAPYPQVSSQTVCVSQVANTDTGLGAVFQVAGTNTLAAGSPATVVDTTTSFPTYVNHSLVFNIPKGDKGDQGAQGNQGPQGPTGPQGPQGDTNATATAALTIALTAQATAIAAGAAASGAVAVNATQDIAIAGLQADSIAQDGRITTVEVKTTYQSYGLLTGTTFATNVNVSNIGVAPGVYAVYLPANATAEFLYGISSSNTISTTSTLISTGGTSQMSSLLVNNNFEVANDATITSGEMYITRTLLPSQKKLVLYDNNTGDNYDYLGLWTNSSNAFNFEGMNGGTYNWYFGNGLGTARSLAKTLSLSADNNYQATSTFLKSVGASQQIQLIRDTPNNKVRIDLIGDVAGVNQYDGQIIQEKGNSLDDNRGIMSLLSGTINLTARNDVNITSTTADIVAQANTNVNIITPTVLIDSGQTTINSSETTASGIIMNTNTSGYDIVLDNLTTSNYEIHSAVPLLISAVGKLQLDCVDFDVNISGATTIDSAGQMDLNVADQLTIATTVPGFDFNINAAQDLNINSGGVMTLATTLDRIELNTTAALTSGVIRLNAGDRIDCDAVSNIELTSQADIIASATDVDITATTGIIRTTSAGETEINCVGFDVNAGGGAVTIDTTSTSAITSTGAMTLTTNGTLQTNSGAFDLNATGNMTMDTTGSMAFTNGTGTTLTSPSLALTRSGGGTFNISSVNPVSIITTTIGDDITVQAAGQLRLTSTLTGVSSDGIIITSSTTGGNDIYLSNPVDTAFAIKCADELQVSTTNNNSMFLTTSGTGSIELISGALLNLTGGTSITMTSVGTIGIASSTDDITIDAYGANTINGGSIALTSASTLVATADSNMNITSTLGDINLTATTNNINLTAGYEVLLDAPNITIPTTGTFNLIPAGTILTSVVITVPTGYLYCNGQAVSRTIYSRLYTAIGTTFGVGNGLSTFNVPDFRGAFLRGTGSQTVSGTTYTGNSIGLVQQDAVLNPLYASNQGYYNVDSGGGGASRQLIPRSRITTDPVDTNTGILPRFDRTATENRPFNYSVYYYIKY